VVYLTVTLLSEEGETILDLSGRSAGNKPILDFVKPRIQRKFGSELLNRGHHLVITMYRRGDRDWSSPASLFKVGCGQRFGSDAFIHYILTVTISM